MSAPPKTLLGAGAAVSDGIFLPDVRPPTRSQQVVSEIKTEGERCGEDFLRARQAADFFSRFKFRRFSA